MSDKRTSIIFPGDNRPQLEVIHQSAMDRLNRAVASDPEAAEDLAIVERTHNQIVTNLRATAEGISAMLMMTTRQRNSAVEELNAIEKDLMHGTSHHPIIQGWIERQTERTQLQIMGRLINHVASSLEIESFDADTILMVIADQHPQFYLDADGKQAIIDIIVQAAQKARATA